jgi:tetratricopeptide (TPR) repeat protein/tRNA A-37 threonylcarbamoyl transferase component Bud32
MGDDERIDQLLSRWEQVQGEGHTLTPEELCRDCPELVEPIRRRVQLLRAFNPLLQATSVDRTKSFGPPAPAGAAPAAVPGYEILGELGRGGMGVVYKARQTGLGRVVALKMVLSGGRASSAELGRFRAEAEAVARLQHPNIIQIYEIGEHEGCPFFSMEYAAGGSLSQRLGDKPLPPREAATLVETLARAVQVAHQHGIVHRDLKPANVLLAFSREPRASAPALARGSRLNGGVPKITDFGLAKRLDVDSGQTRSGDILGTPSYMAPEQAAGKSKAIGPAADIYALGAILYQALTARPPFQGPSVLDTLRQVLSAEPVTPSRLQPQAARDLDTICLKCLQKEPGKRYASAWELAEDLRRFLAGEPIRARPVGAWERGLKWARRRPLVAALSGLVVLVTALGFGLVTWKWREAEANADAELRARRRAEQKEKEANRQKQIAQQKEKEANRQKQIAQRNLKAVILMAKTFRNEADRFATDLGNDRVWQPSMLGKLRQGLSIWAARYAGAFVEVPSDRLSVVKQRAEAYYRLVQAAAARASLAEAAALYEGARDKFAWLLERHPGVTFFRDKLATAGTALGTCYRLQKKWRQAAAALRQAQAVTVQLICDHPAEADYQNLLAEIDTQQGMLYDGLGKPNRARRALERAIALRELLHKVYAGLRFAVPLAETYRQRALLAVSGKNRREALVWLGRAVRLLASGVRRPGAPASARQTLRNVHEWRADLLAKLGRYSEALPDWDRAIALDPGPGREELRIRRADTLVRLGKHAQVRAEVDALVAAKGATGLTSYFLAGVCAQASSVTRKDPGLAEQYARRAVELLHKARAAGLFANPNLVRYVAKDKELDPLRRRKDFKEFLAGLSRKKK